MKTLQTATIAMALAAAVNLSPASATERPGAVSHAAAWGNPQTSDYQRPSVAPGAPHYEWQYRYVGRHPRYQGHWVLVY